MAFSQAAVHFLMELLIIHFLCLIDVIMKVVVATQIFKVNKIRQVRRKAPLWEGGLFFECWKCTHSIKTGFVKQFLLTIQRDEIIMPWPMAGAIILKN